MSMYHAMGKMWRLTLHTLYYICCTKLQNLVLRQTRKSHQYMLEATLLAAIRTIVSMRHSSHSLYCESSRLCTLSLNKFGSLSIILDTIVKLRECLPYSNDQNILECECMYGTYGPYYE